MITCRRCPERKNNRRGIAGRAWHACTNLWRKPICRPGRIDHWMYERDNAKALAAYNQCSHHKPGPEHSRCTPWP